MAAVVLECGHPVSAIVEIDGEPRCGACIDSEPVEAEAVEEVEEERRDEQGEETEEREDEDGGTEVEPGTPGVEEGVIEVGAVEAEPGSPLDEIRAVAARVEQRQDRADSTPPQPAYGQRGTEPGRRGCWALNARGEPCGSFRRRDSDFCNGHAGISGVGADPARYAPLALEARRHQLATRATLRMVMGDRGRLGPRAILREHVNREAVRLAGRAMNGALNPDVDDVKAAQVAIRLIEAADPRDQATLELSANISPEQINAMSWSEALAYARQHGIELPEGCHELPQPSVNG